VRGVYVVAIDCVNYLNYSIYHHCPHADTALEPTAPQTTNHHAFNNSLFFLARLDIVVVQTFSALVFNSAIASNK
jgi:hypothetical protein